MRNSTRIYDVRKNAELMMSDRNREEIEALLDKSHTSSVRRTDNFRRVVNYESPTPFCHVGLFTTIISS
jgi:hypothetical protein